MSKKETHYVTSFLRRMGNAFRSAFAHEEINLKAWDPHKIYDHSRDEVMEGRETFGPQSIDKKEAPTPKSVYEFTYGRSLKMARGEAKTPQENYCAARDKVGLDLKHRDEIGDSLYPERTIESFEVIPPEPRLNLTDSKRRIDVGSLKPEDVERIERESHRVPVLGDRFTNYGGRLSPGHDPNEE